MLPIAGDKFDPKLFNNPATFHRPVYMWCWNSPITADMLIAQLCDLAAAGGGGVMIVPEPSYFRPTTMITTLSPDYLTEEYFKIYEAVAAQAEKLGMKIWFYDEGGWPSGSACGKVTQKYPHLAREKLTLHQKNVRKGDTINEDVLASFLYCDEGVKRVFQGERVSRDGMLVNISVQTPVYASEPLYPDLLNSEAVRAFIEIGCEPYLPYIGKFAPNTVPMLFTDETSGGNPPWSDALAQAFLAEKGYDIVGRLNELFENDEKGAQTRIDYFDFWSRRFAKTFFGAMRTWCNQNNMAFGGHLGGDDSLDCLKRHSYGHPLRMYREMDVPGIDTILRQIFPGGRRGQNLIQDRKNTDFAPNYHFPRWASSVARQAGSPWVLSESFAVYGQGLTPAQMKWIINYQLVRGITMFCAATLASSVSGAYMANERPVHSPKSPMWQCLGAFHDYTARLSYLLSLGAPLVKTALYMPVRDVWSNTARSLQVMAAYDTLANKLESKKIDFDVVDDDALETAKIENGCLCVGNMCYETVVLPKCRHMTPAAAQKLDAFKKVGGAVFFDTKTFSSPIIIQPALAPVALTMRKLSNGTLYFLVNEAENEIAISAIFNEKKQPVLLDPQTGKMFEQAYTINGDKIKISLLLPFAGSVTILFSNKKIPTLPLPAQKQTFKHVIVLDKGWVFVKKESFVIGEQEFEQHVLHEKPVPAVLGPWVGYTGEDFSGGCAYAVDFDLPAREIGKKVVLNLGKVEYACRANLNGKDLGLCPWPPFEYDVSKTLKPGKNRLKITVYNTPANQYVHTKSFEKWDDATVGRYHKPALVFERETLGGGLFGKVALYVE